MLHNPIRADTAGGPYVTLSSPEIAARATKELDKAPLFDRRVQLKLLDLRSTFSDTNVEEIPPEFNWGWFATPNPDLRHIRQRSPRWYVTSMYELHVRHTLTSYIYLQGTASEHICVYA
jgi:hypothetical protein